MENISDYIFLMYLSRYLSCYLDVRGLIIYFVVVVVVVVVIIIIIIKVSNGVQKV